MSSFIYLDIETIPVQDALKTKVLLVNAKPPANMKKPETIEKWRSEGAGDVVAKTSFNGGAGHICCIVMNYITFNINDIADEKEMLENFARTIQIGFAETIPVIVGHGSNEFDIRFIWQRAICLGVKLPNWFPKDPKPWGGDTFDTMLAWAGSRGKVSLDNLAGYLGLEGKTGVDGSMVAGMFARGEHGAIAEYCRADVALTKSIHEKMMAAGL